MNLKHLKQLSDAADRADTRAHNNSKSVQLGLIASKKRIDVAIEMIKLLKKEAKNLDGIDRVLVSYNARCTIDELNWVKEVMIPTIEDIYNEN
jgi:cell fate (sporulation/competence/biofilm development) regulator YmcA (YheA/YmcA/DUF963 family)